MRAVGGWVDWFGLDERLECVVGVCCGLRFTTGTSSNPSTAVLELATHGSPGIGYPRAFVF